MSSSKVNNDPKAEASSGQVVVDPEAVLVREPGLIVDPRFLAPLRDELTAELGAAGGMTALMQIGCMHGLRDAEIVTQDAFAAPSAYASVPGTPALALRLRGEARTQGGVTVTGTWPEAPEAQAWLGTRPTSTEPVCAVSAGYTSGWLSGLFECDMIAIETACMASGAPECQFVAHDRATCLESHDPHSLLHAEMLPIDALRAALAVPVPGAFLNEDPAAEGDPTVIHIWGPVMVIPFGNLDEALEAVELLRTDPTASSVSVVVMDLTGEIIDEAFGAVSLETIIESATGSGAEVILAGVSPLSEEAVAGLEHAPIMLCKDLHSGIAAGFQVADSQRRIL